MSYGGKPGEFEHYRANGGQPVIRPITARRVIDRIAPPGKPRRDKSDAMLGKWISANARHGGPAGNTYGNPVERITGQVWCAARREGGYGVGWYWIASEGRYLVAHERTFEALAERSEDVPMLEVAS